MLEYAYHLVSFGAGGLSVCAVTYVLARKWDRQRTQLESDLSCVKWERDSLRCSFDTEAHASREHRDARQRLQNKYDAANVLIDRLHGELDDLKARALFRNAKGQMTSLKPAKKAPKAKPYVASANSLGVVA